MRSELAALTFGLVALTGQGQARDWGFSRDTVKEWDGVTTKVTTIDGVTLPRPLMDTLRIWNTGADTIWFDTAWLEVITPTEPEKYFQYVGYDFGSSEGFAGIVWGIYDINRPELPGYSPQRWVDKNRDKLITGVRLNGKLKSENIKPESTLTIVRAIYKARDRGQDTLIVVGDYPSECCIVKLENTKHQPLDKAKSQSAFRVNAQGQHVKNADASPRTRLHFSTPIQKKVGE